MTRSRQQFISCHRSGNGDIDLDKLLQGRYEAELLPRDFSSEGAVPDFAFNVLNREGLLYRPVADEEYLAQGGPKPVWPHGKPFCVCLTHDVDFVTLYSYRQAMRDGSHAVSQAETVGRAARVGLSLAARLVRDALHKHNPDPYHSLDRWIETERTAGVRSTFFFWPGWSRVTKHHYSDCSYEMSDLVVFEGQKITVRDIIQEIDRRGWEIGVHASWYSYNDADELKRQKETLEKVVGHEIAGIRQHCLHYDIRVTPRVHAAAGFRYDSTLGFNDNVGFRLGTCYPRRLQDAQSGEQLPIVEVPLVIQDMAMLNPAKGMRLDEETAFRYVQRITESVESVAGVLTLLWHPNSTIDSPPWRLYLRVLEYLKGKDAWFAPAGSVAGPAAGKTDGRQNEQVER